MIFILYSCRLRIFIVTTCKLTALLHDLQHDQQYLNLMLKLCKKNYNIFSMFFNFAKIL